MHGASKVVAVGGGGWSEQAADEELICGTPLPQPVELSMATRERCFSASRSIAFSLTFSIDRDKLSPHTRFPLAFLVIIT